MKVDPVGVKVHEYFPITLDYTTRGEVKMDMRKYMRNIIDEFPVNINKSQAVKTPASNNMFKVDESKPLNNDKAEFS